MRWILVSKCLARKRRGITLSGSHKMWAINGAQTGAYLFLCSGCVGRKGAYAAERSDAPSTCRWTIKRMLLLIKYLPLRNTNNNRYSRHMCCGSGGGPYYNNEARRKDKNLPGCKVRMVDAKLTGRHVASPQAVAAAKSEASLVSKLERERVDGEKVRAQPTNPPQILRWPRGQDDFGHA
jgi:hypothetical protein